jgi:crotonobetainyl-CoA:carnitine CoA-transferase CaiB-like acyl-CoA transferase
MAAETSPSEPARAGPLAGVTVIDLTAVVLGPLTTQILGDLGADVIKIEPPEGDIMRAGGAARHSGMGSVYLALNRNKRSVVLDLKQPEGAAVLRRLIADADVVIHNMRAAAIARLGFDYDAVKAINPRIVYCAAYGFSEHGPYRDYPAYDDLIQARAGIAALAQAHAPAPQFAPTLIADKTVGLTAVYAVLAALFHRERTGEGQTIEVPMFETMVAFTLAEHLGGLSFEPPLGAAGYARLLAPDRRPHRTTDGHVAILPYTTRHWRDFFALAERPALADDPRFADPATRNRHIGELYGVLAELVATRSTAFWLDGCRRADIPAAPVNELAALPGDPHLAAVGLFAHTEHPSEGAILELRPPVNFGATPASLRRPAPRLGADTEAVLREHGYDAAAIAALARQGAIKLDPV